MSSRGGFRASGLSYSTESEYGSCKHDTVTLISVLIGRDVARNEQSRERQAHVRSSYRAVLYGTIYSMFNMESFSEFNAALNLIINFIVKTEEKVRKLFISKFYFINDNFHLKLFEYTTSSFNKYLFYLGYSGVKTV